MTRPTGDRPAWTALGARMGLTRERSQRHKILIAAAGMTWSPRSARPWCSGGTAVWAVAAAIARHSGAGLRAVGIARLKAGQKLIGLEHNRGVRRYLLDCGAEAIHLLTESRGLGDSANAGAAVFDCCTGEPITRDATEPITRDATKPATVAIEALLDAYRGNTYRLLRDLANHLGASLAYVDRPTVEAHLERALSDSEWAAVRAQFRGMDLDEHLGGCGSARTDWIETVLAKAGVPGCARTTYTVELPDRGRGGR